MLLLLAVQTFKLLLSMIQTYFYHDKIFIIYKNNRYQILNRLNEFCILNIINH